MPLHQKRFTVLLSVGAICKLHGFIMVFQHDRLYFLQTDAEIFAAVIDHVHTPVRKGSMECCFQLGRIVRENHGMNIEHKGNGSVPKLIDTLHGIQTAGHTDLVNALAKGADVGNDINISGFLIALTVIDILQL